jgi:HEAT repeat protein
MSTRLANFFGIKTSEVSLVLLLMLHSFFMGMPRTIGGSVAIGLLKGNQVPISLIFSAILATFVTLGLDALARRWSFLRLIYGNLIVQALSLFMFFVAFMLLGTKHEVLNVTFFVWIQIVMMLTYREYWGLAGQLLDIRQGKRLFALISSGEVIFAILMVFLKDFVQHEEAISGLLLFTVLGVIGSIMVVFIINRRFGNLLSDSKWRRGPRRGRAEQQLVFNRYVFSILAISAVYAIAFGLAQQIYINALDTNFASKDARVRFIFVLTALTSLANLLIRFFAVDRLLARFGVTAGLLILPILVLLSGTALSAVFLIDPTWAMSVMFWMVIVMRGNYMVLRSSIDRPAALILLQTIAEKPRNRLLNIQDGIVAQVFTGFTGLVLFIPAIIDAIPNLNNVFPILEGIKFGADILTYALTFVTMLWVIAVVLTLRDYGASVLEILQRREIGAFSDLFQDRRNLNRIKMNLKSESPMEVMYALHVLDTLQDALLAEALKELLKHTDDMVRGEVLRLIEKNRLKTLLPQITLISQREPQENVRAIAVRALSALGEDDVFDVLMKYLKSRYPHIRTNAIIGLLRSGDLSSIINAGNALLELVESKQVEDRIQAATILGEVGNRDFYRLLVDLLQDESVAVRNEALISAGKLKNPKLWPLVINCLTQHATRSAAVRALREADESMLQYFEPFFEDNKTAPSILITLTRICSRMEGNQVRLFLIVHSDVRNLNVRKYVLEALAERNYRAETAEAKKRIMRHIQSELNFATWCMAAAIALQSYAEKTEIVVNALREEIVQTKARVFYWLSYIYDADIILNAKSKMAIATSNEWALILEALDQTLESSLRPRVLPLYERLSLEEQFARLNHLFPQNTSLDAIGYLEYIIGEEGVWIDPWLRTSALYVAPFIAQDADLSESLYVAVRFDHPMVAETALWSLSVLAPSLYKLYISRRDSEPSDLSSKTVGVVEDTIGLIRKIMSGGETMLLTIEKVLILKRVSIFADTSEEFLADISTLLDELNVSAGETVIEKGEEPSYLYIITDGVLEVRDGEHVLANLGANDIFGELSLFLDAPIHTAAVVAKTNVHILTLHRDDFQEILYDYAQVAHGIIRELAKRLHQSNQRNIELSS